MQARRANLSSKESLLHLPPENMQYLEVALERQLGEEMIAINDQIHV